MNEGAEVGRLAHASAFVPQYVFPCCNRTSDWIGARVLLQRVGFGSCLQVATALGTSSSPPRQVAARTQIMRTEGSADAYATHTTAMHELEMWNDAFGWRQARMQGASCLLSSQRCFPFDRQLFSSLSHPPT